VRGHPAEIHAGGLPIKRRSQRVAPRARRASTACSKQDQPQRATCHLPNPDGHTFDVHEDWCTRRRGGNIQRRTAR
jgi:hypothetical protein